MAVIVDLTGGMVSLRSRRPGPDCSVIAALYGGGGHAGAAAFRMMRESVFSLLSQEIFG